MATIYRFIVEQKTTSGRGGGRKGTKPSKGTTAKKGKWVGIFSTGERGGVEHNRKMRAINPLINKATGGWWERSNRLGRAGIGLLQKNTLTGKLALSGVAIAIIVSFAIQMIMKIQARDILIAQKQNTQDFKAMENGVGAVRGAYDISVNLWNGRRTYNQNK